MGTRPRSYETAVGVVIVAVLAVVFFLSGGGTAERTHPDRAQTSATAVDGSGTIGFRRLPPEAQQTVRLIRQGGPFRYSQVGAGFANREGHLPAEPRGFYHEYTVDTPGSPDRGARRIVAGQQGQLFYTDDHYRTFKRIIGTG
jgi:ribonuclease T1